jgi:hypothetical protein
MKEGKLFYNTANDRPGIIFNNGSIDCGLHCGATLQAFIGGRWVDTRVESNGEDWLLVSLFKPGKIPHALVVRV